MLMTQLRRMIPIEIEFCKIKSHQDRITEAQDLPFETQLNIPADDLATNQYNQVTINLILRLGTCTYVMMTPKK